MPNRRYHPRSFGLLFHANELLPTANPPCSHFIEGTIYQEEGQPGHNASGRAESRYAAAPAASFEFDHLSELASKLGLTQDAVNTLVARITSTISRP